MAQSRLAGSGLFRVASYWLLISAVGHSIGHYFYYIDVAGFTERRASLYAAMQGYVADGLLGTSMWEILQMFSLSFSLLLLFTGLINLVLDRLELSAAAFRKITVTNLSLWLLGLISFAFLHPVIQPLLIAGVAGVLYGLSWWKQRLLPQAVAVAD